jgi:hypothetical protein
MPRESFSAGDFVIKGQEAGTVVQRRSHRTGRDYLTVSITKGPRRGQLEFPERGWRIDDGSVGGNERPAHEPEDVFSGRPWKTERRR